MELTDIARRFIVHWGEMGSNWGVNRSVAQIHALLFVHGQPLHAEDIADTLVLARSNVSNSLKELLNWRLIRVTHVLGDRRDYYETSGDVWELFRTIVRERKEREFDPTVALLRELSQDPALDKEAPALQDRLRSTLDFMQTLGSWSDEMLRLSPATLEKILRLGAQVQRFVRPGDGAETGAPNVFPVTPPMPPMG
ncbi:DNA-binding transcriptional regulator GbsR (MarR family) [Pelomonas saccharophila]|uniref:HTH-type transcriptional regulator n=1 Tax=Roseateles saccharophilus TaxID=304 RepID=A0ABU1YJT9_ROSSA|nr:MarR family transcriptional regulator [Roseateles saccharophilus]MDR7268490.1 DNA-binding transcriptional regulator GbsR (MarR family) [Roseateles saccharophilus]